MMIDVRLPDSAVTFQDFPLIIPAYVFPCGAVRLFFTGPDHQDAKRRRDNKDTEKDIIAAAGKMFIYISGDLRTDRVADRAPDPYTSVREFPA